MITEHTSPFLVTSPVYWIASIIKNQVNWPMYITYGTNQNMDTANKHAYCTRRYISCVYDLTSNTPIVYNRYSHILHQIRGAVSSCNKISIQQTYPTITTNKNKFTQLFDHVDIQSDATLRFRTINMLCLHVDLTFMFLVTTKKSPAKFALIVQSLLSVKQSIQWLPVQLKQKGMAFFIIHNVPCPFISSSNKWITYK